MKAKFVNEKFEEKSDPIIDMGIGTEFRLGDVYKQNYFPTGKEKYTNEEFDRIKRDWLKCLNDLLAGRTISATLQRYPSMTIKQDTITVKNAIKSEFERYFVKYFNKSRDYFKSKIESEEFQ